MRSKLIIIALILAAGLIGGAALLSRGVSSGQTETASAGNNVHIVDGKQIIEISAKGGYQPRQSIAKAGLPTIIRFDTVATFDCSSSVRIPSLGISKLLPQTGQTDVDVGTPGKGPLAGTCGMGMYPFQVTFE